MNHFNSRLADPDASPIVKGKLGKPVQFGFKTQIIEAEGGFVTDYTVERDNPPDADAFLPAVQRRKPRFRRAPAIVATDRGYDTASNHTGCRDLGVRNVAIPKRGKLSTDRRRFQHRQSFRQAQAWRSGSEATDSADPVTRGTTPSPPAWGSRSSPTTSAAQLPGSRPSPEPSPVRCVPLRQSVD